MGDYGAQSRALHVLGEREDEIGGTRERDLHQHAVGSLQHVTARILVEQRSCGRELVAEAQLEARARPHTLVGGADVGLALVAEGEVRPDVRRGEEECRSVRRGGAAETEPFLD
jgi:hypothetical protein